MCLQDSGCCTAIYMTDPQLEFLELIRKWLGACLSLIPCQLARLLLRCTTAGVSGNCCLRTLQQAALRLPGRLVFGPAGQHPWVSEGLGTGQLVAACVCEKLLEKRHLVLGDERQHPTGMHFAYDSLQATQMEIVISVMDWAWVSRAGLKSMRREATCACCYHSAAPVAVFLPLQTGLLLDGNSRRGGIR